MVEILPKYDPGAEIGQQFGAGLSQALKMLGERKMQENVFDQIKKLDPTKMSEQDLVAEYMKAGAYVPGGMKQMAPFLESAIRKKRGQEFVQSQTDLYGQDGGISAEGLGSMLNIASQGVPGPLGSLLGLAGGALENMQQAGPQTGPQAGEQDLQTQPRRGDQRIGDGLLTGAERISIAQQYADQGPQAQREAIAEAEERKRETRQLKIDEREQEFTEQERERTRSEQREQKMRSEVERTLKTRKLPKNIDAERVGRALAQGIREKNPTMSDEQINAEVARKAERYIGALAKIDNAAKYQPYRLGASQRAEADRLQAKNFLKEYGNNMENRNLLRSIYMEKGYPKDAAYRLTNPMNANLGKFLSDYIRQEATVRGQPGMPVFDKFMDQVERRWKDTDSPWLLKSDLVKELNVTENMANEIIFDLQKRLESKGKGIPEHQNQELSDIRENADPYLLDMIFGGRLMEGIAPDPTRGMRG